MAGGVDDSYFIHCGSQVRILPQAQACVAQRKSISKHSCRLIPLSNNQSSDWLEAMVSEMGRAFVKGGTPVGSESLCRTCSNAHMMTGYRESELVTMCNGVHPNIVVPFLIYECTGYYDKQKPTWEQMRKFAIDISPGNSKPVGFKTGLGFQDTRKLVRVAEDEEVEDEHEDED